MRSVLRLRNVAIASLLVLAALLLLARGADEARASLFVPSLSTAVSPLTPGAPADITSTSSWQNAPNPTRSFPTGIANSTPGPDDGGVLGWGMYAANPTDTVAAPTDAIPIGTATGSDSMVMTLGLLNSACAINIPLTFAGVSQPPSVGTTTALLDASTDNSAGNTIAPGAGFSALINDTNGNGVMDGAEKWNDLLAALGLPAPRERQVATTNLFGTTIWVDRPTYNPGDLSGLEESLGFATGQLPLAEGFFTLTIIQNFSLPILSPTPSLITDHCGFTTSTTQCGRAPITTPGVCPAAGTPHRTNPATPGTFLFFLRSVSERDADIPTADGIVNSNDTCPFDINVPADSDGDGIDNACDAAFTPFNPDVDGDLVPNRGDNCPQDPNPQTDLQELIFWPPTGGPRFDAIGDACDGVVSVGNPLGLGNLTVPDGHFHSSPTLAPVCIGLADADGDGFCDIDEGTSVSNPPSAGSIVVDGQFGPPAGEWGDVTPLAFLGGQSIVYTSLDQGQEAIYLMYDLGASTAPLGIGETAGPISFDALCLGVPSVFDVFFTQGGPNTGFDPNPASSVGGTGDTVDVFVNAVFAPPGSACNPILGAESCIEGGVDHNSTSPNFAFAHNLFELEVCLVQTPETPSGNTGGVYSPDPAFWGADLPTGGGTIVSESFVDIGSGGVTTVTTVTTVGTPENIAIATTCSDGLDNDDDGDTDLADTGCQLPDHDIATRKINGDALVGGASECQPLATTGCGYNIILRNNTSADEQGQLGILVDPIFGAGCSGPIAFLHGGSAKPVLNVAGPINNDGDNDVEFLLIVDVTIPANSQRTVNLGVVYPTCAPPAVPGTPADYIILADLCHADDLAPLGLFATAACGGSADGGQDRVNLGNDAPVIRVINDANR